MTDPVRALRAAGALSALDAELAERLGHIGGERRTSVLLAAALVSRMARDGHVCADLTRLAGTALRDEDGEAIATCPALDSWRSELLTSELVSDGERIAPLVLDARSRLYLRGHWDDERRLARALLARVHQRIEPVRSSELRGLVKRTFGAAQPSGPDWQRIAAQIAAVSPLCVVSGGPGTGKTTTVTKIVALALADATARGNARPHALLLAPTGKAAARLAEAAAAAKGVLDLPAFIKDRIPTEARTIHRALEADRSGRFRIDADRPLFADVVVVDEASMIDVTLMRALVEAVPARARLVLLGDHHQLASVDAGAVLADVCRTPLAARYSRALAARVERTFGESLPPDFVGDRPPGIDDAVVTLTKSHRFAISSPLGELSLAIQAGDPDRVLALLRGGSEDVTLIEPDNERSLDERLVAIAVTGFRPLAAAPTASEALERLARFRVLSAERRGPAGVEEANRRIERALADAGALNGRSGLVHPLLVNRNDASLGLFNGDVGVLFRDTESATLRAVFRSANGEVRTISPSRLPPNEPAFAMSVHKSQGSELDEVAVILPRPGAPLLTRELLYTAITRARCRVVVHASGAAVREAVTEPAARASGLSDALRGTG